MKYMLYAIPYPACITWNVNSSCLDTLRTWTIRNGRRQKEEEYICKGKNSCTTKGNKAAFLSQTVRTYVHRTYHIDRWMKQ